MTNWGTLPQNSAVLCDEPGDKEPVVTSILLVTGNVLNLVTDKFLPPSDIRYLDASIETQTQHNERIRLEREQREDAKTRVGNP